MKICKKCGKKIVYNARFCPYCGTVATKKIEEKNIKNATKSQNGKGPLKMRLISIIVVSAIALIIAGILGRTDNSTAQSLTGNLEMRDKDGNVLITTADIGSAETTTILGENGNQEYSILLSFTNEGTLKFADVTADLLKKGEQLYIYIDDQCVEVAQVNVMITNGKAYITRTSSYEEAERTLACLYGTEEGLDNRVDELEILDELTGIEEINKNGNTNVNLHNGGWVTEQGDWNYYAIRNHILKENVITGEKKDIFIQAEDTVFENLHIMGEWIYFSKKNDTNNILRIKVDGTYYQKLQTDWSDDITFWDTYNNKLYVILYEHKTASKYRYFLAEVNWDTGMYYEIAEIPESYTGVLGIEDGYAYFVKAEKNNLSMVTSEITYSWCYLNLDSGTLGECSWTDEYEYEKFSSVGEMCIKDGFICFLYSWSDAIVSKNHKYYMAIHSIYDEDDEFLFIQLPSINETFNFYGTIEEVIFGGDTITRFLPGEDVEVTVVEDSTRSICIAHGKIYYTYGSMYCEIDMDGSNWAEINTVENRIELKETQKIVQEEDNNPVLIGGYYQCVKKFPLEVDDTIWTMSKEFFEQYTGIVFQEKYEESEWNIIHFPVLKGDYYSLESEESGAIFLKEEGLIAIFFEAWVDDIYSEDIGDNIQDWLNGNESKLDIGVSRYLFWEGDDHYTILFSCDEDYVEMAYVNKKWITSASTVEIEEILGEEFVDFFQ